MWQRNVLFLHYLPRSFQTRVQPCFYGYFLKSYACLKIDNLWKNGIFLYISILNPEKYVNRHNFAWNDPFVIKFGQKSDINKINILWKFGENQVKWRHVTCDVISGHRCVRHKHMTSQNADISTNYSKRVKMYVTS